MLLENLAGSSNPTTQKLATLHVHLTTMSITNALAASLILTKAGFVDKYGWVEYKIESEYTSTVMFNHKAEGSTTEYLTQADVKKVFYPSHDIKRSYGGKKTNYLQVLLVCSISCFFCGVIYVFP